jgi:polyhydroxyalkanoate synthesis regulator phasin
LNFSRTSIALYLALVFASGATLGWYGNHVYTAREEQQAKGKGSRRQFDPNEFRKNYLAGMKKQLTLSDDQVQKLSGVLDETRALMNELQKRQLPEQFEIQNAQQKKIRAIFDDEQLKKYDAMLERIRQGNKKNKNSNDNTRPDSSNPKPLPQ